MNRTGPVIVIEDDEDDRFLLAEVFKELEYSNELIFFNDGLAALNFLTQGEKYPFLILSDINLPKLNGIELREKLKVDADLHLKCTPYLFFTTAADHNAVIDAYSASVQGFFTKPSTYEGIKDLIKTIVEYWRHCSAPNYFMR